MTILFRGENLQIKKVQGNLLHYAGIISKKTLRGFFWLSQSQDFQGWQWDP